jgi:hypothetical protein
LENIWFGSIPLSTQLWNIHFVDPNLDVPLGELSLDHQWQEFLEIAINISFTFF